MEKLNAPTLSLAKKLWFKTLLSNLLASGYSKTEIAQRIGISPQRLTNLINGSDSLTDKVIDSFSSVFQLGNISIESENSVPTGSVSDYKISMNEKLQHVPCNPFRVGNWVTDIFGHIMQVCMTHGLLATGRYIDEDGKLHEATGHVDRGIGCIELTEEILTKIGFKKGQGGCWYLLPAEKEYSNETCKQILSLEIPHIAYCEPRHTLRIRAFPSGAEDSELIDMYVPCRFVHELQNHLYDARLEEYNFNLIE